MSRRGPRGQEGFTLIEALVAILVLFLVLTSLLVAVGSQHRHLQQLERYAGARGVVNVGAGKAVVSVFSGEAGLQSCEVRLASLESVSGGLRARAQVGDPGTLPEAPLVPAPEAARRAGGPRPGNAYPRVPVRGKGRT